ncbi:RecX family transcriptional regulator [Candidatus Saccharibacteria bacterium]|nr:RecX family transcriptional regulator [Candidatus Saccharibacteria bacterium]
MALEIVSNTIEENSMVNGKTVTDLRVGMRDENRVNVFLDGKFAFSLTIQQVADFKLKRGTILSEVEIAKIQKASNFGKLFQRALEYALSRPHSEREIRDYLKRKKMKREIEQKRYDGFLERLKNDSDYAERVKEIRANVREKNKKISERDFTEDNRFEYVGRAKTGLPTKPGAGISEEDIEAVIAKLCDLKIIDDENFARYFVENRNQIKGTSEKKLRTELKNKGISEAIIASVLSEDEFGEKIRDDKVEIQKMIEKKRRRGYDDAKLTQYLARQGFSYDLIKESLRSVSEDVDDVI